MKYLGDFTLGSTFDTKFTTVKADGSPITLAGSPVVSAYPGNSTTQLTAGITLSVDFDSVTGLHNIRVVATGGNGYAAGDYQLVITTGTIDGLSAVGYVVGEFSIDNRSAAAPLAAIIAALVTIDDFLDTEIAAIKAKTDNLPATPAATGDAMTLTSGERNASADALLNRDMATGTDSGSPSVRTVRQALRALRNKWAFPAGVYTVYKEDDSTASWTGAPTTDAAADPVTGIDPA